MRLLYENKPTTLQSGDNIIFELKYKGRPLNVIVRFRRNDLQMSVDRDGDAHLLSSKFECFVNNPEDGPMLASNVAALIALTHGLDIQLVRRSDPEGYIEYRFYGAVRRIH
jgi:hypothetical protein